MQLTGGVRIPSRASSPGRPRASSAETLESAAEELFLEQGYARTTVEEIALRAGVSRNTFFNYFQAKSDVLWVAFDSRAAALAAELAAQPTDVPVVDAVRSALLAAARGFGPDAVPWAVTHADVMGTRDELSVSGIARFTAQAATVSAFVAPRLDRAPDHPLARSFSFAVIGAVAAASASWVAAGVTRGPLDESVRSSIDPVCAGYGLAFDEFARGHGPFV
ncbi:TetR/AcrR family transcriptional regulator [Marisediminicola sp. LYQ134]|uniref:TetR/AcrR family transcriptional regulator n=1 Tax=unclassified Marisediminicola TaxID=2618316 RepID=UPI003982EE7B